MIYELILKSQHKDAQATQELIERFLPLIKKYAYQLHTEDAEQELLLFFIELLAKIPIELLAENSDGKIVNYIYVSIKNQYNHLVSQKLKYPAIIHLSCLSEEQQHWLEKALSTTDNVENLLLDTIKNILNENEFEIIYLHYFKQYTISEIAKIKKKSRQAINQMHLRAVKKLTHILA